MKTVEQRLMDYSKLDPSTGCRLWLRHCSRKGYGQTWYQGKLQTTHRVSYQVFVGPIPKGLCVLHSCHNRACINPEHLRVGTNQDNSDDMVRAGRSTPGERNPRAKLTWEKVRTIRQKCSSGDYTQSEVSSLVGVDPRMVSRIVRGEIWKESVSQ